MFESDFLTKVGTLNDDYLCKGQHFVKLVSEDQENIYKELSLTEDSFQNENLNKITEKILEDIKENVENPEEINFLFTGNVYDGSEIERNKWFLNFLTKYSNRFTNYFFNKKLKILSKIIGFFFSVSSLNESTLLKCNLQHCFAIASNPSNSNITSNLIWFDPTFSYKGSQTCSAYKIFYIIAMGTENPIMSSSNSHFIETRFITPNSRQSAKAEFTNVSQLLREIQFSENEVKSIFEVLISLIELSQYRAQGDDKKIEFSGSGHFKKAAEYLQVKEKQLRDFIINEYSWQENKRKLKNPKILNSEIDSFISGIYEILVDRILEKFNSFVETDPKNEEFVRVNFLHSSSLPNFEREQTFLYGDYFQYFVSNLIESVGYEAIENKVKTFINYSRTELPKLSKSKTQPINKTIFNQISDLIRDQKNSKNPLDYFHKLEKTSIKEVKFLKINQRVFIDIFIPEFVSFIRFDWQSFIQDSFVYCPRQMDSFLKLSGNLLLKSCNRKTLTKRVWNDNKFSWLASSRSTFDSNFFFVHVLLKETVQKRLKYPLADQVINTGLQCLEIEEITFKRIPMEDFLNKYRVVFLSYDDNSFSVNDAVKLAIKRLKLDKVWCSSDSIYLHSLQIDEIERLVENYEKFVLKIQKYARIILAKIKLKKLKLLSDQYKAEYLEAIIEARRITDLFFEEYSPVLRVDRENIDLDILSKISPSLNLVEHKKIHENNYAEWLSVTIMSESSVLHSETFSSSEVCLFYSKEEQNTMENCLDVGKYLSPSLASQINNCFIFKISIDNSEDVYLDLKAKEPLYVWNVETSINKKKRNHLPLSKGFLLPGNRYRIFSNDYFIKKMAYNTLNNISYDVFNDLVQECSSTIIIEHNYSCQPSLSNSPLWVSINNFLPLINLQSSSTFNLVDKERQRIDKTECSKHINGLYIRPKNDWLMENIQAHLMVITLEKTNFLKTLDTTDKELIGRLSNSIIEFGKRNYKTRKYLNK